MSNIRHLRPLANAAAWTAGSLVTLHGQPYVIVRDVGEYADLFPGDDLFRVTAVGRIQARTALLTRRERTVEHYVTVEPARPDDPAHYTAIWDAPPRLCIAEHHTGRLPVFHGTEGWIPLRLMREHARRVASVVGAEFREPSDALAVELLGVGA